jgi:hypothetical protein
MYLSIYLLYNFLIYYVISICKFYVSFKICNRIKLVYFLKFVVHKINSKMVKSKIVLLTRKEKTDVADADVTMDWIL